MTQSVIEGVFLNFISKVMREKSLEGECLIESEGLKLLIEKQFQKKIEFKKDYLESELFVSPLFN